MQCIDILRAMTTHKDALPAFFGRVRRSRGASAQFDAFATRVELRAAQVARRVASGEDESRQARALADDMAVCLQVGVMAAFFQCCYAFGVRHDMDIATFTELAGRAAAHNGPRGGRQGVCSEPCVQG